VSSDLFEYPVRHDDLDFMGIIGNTEWITILTRARIDLLERIDYPMTMLMQQKIGGVVSELTVKYLMPVRFGDIVEIQITPTNQFVKGLTLHYSVTNQRNEVCLIADVTMIFINQDGKSIKMPKPIATKLFGVLDVH
jgi:acyl-CoA thioester hydrolase